MKTKFTTLIAVLIAGIGAAALLGGGDPVGEIVYVPTPEPVVKKMLKMANVTKKDVVFDLGCGDGRVVAMAAKIYGARGVGVDIDPARIKDSLNTLKKYKVPENLVEIRQGNALQGRAVKDLEKATVVFLYMLQPFMDRFAPIAKKRLKPGTRIVSHHFLLKNWKAKQFVNFNSKGIDYKLYLYIVPKPKNK